MSTSTDRDRERGVQTVRNAWINALRNEVLRSDIPELPRIVAIGIWISTYADADGSSAFPGRETLAKLAGAAPQTVTNAVHVLVAAGVLQRQRRPNQSSLFQLVIPTERPDWGAHMHLYTETKQKEYRRRKAAEARAAKAAEAARKASQDSFRKGSPSNGPERVPGLSPNDPEGVPGPPRKESPDPFRKGSPTNAYQFTPTSGRDPERDQETADVEPQPQVDGPAAPHQDPSPSQHHEQTDEAPALRRCADCGQPVLRAGRTHCAAHTQPRAHPGAA
ncbi:hypothetical protein [Streptomyces sp. CA-111067]|uniref:hypothetical protein n=1 Tax=Streptomyces sp. CA-111067 TaxID=3240046 RepID=UPI003D985578